MTSRKCLLLVLLTGVLISQPVFGDDSCNIGDNKEVRILYVRYDAHNHYVKIKLNGVFHGTDVVYFVLGNHGISESDLRGIEAVALTALTTGMRVQILLHDCKGKKGYSLFIIKQPLPK